MRVKPKVMYRKIDNEYYVLEPETNTFLNFNEVGNFIFEKIIAGMERGQIVEEITENYSVDQKTAWSDVEEFLQELIELKIIG